MEKIKWILSIILGMISAFTRQYGMILTFVGVVIILDWITGIISAKCQGIPISSKKGAAGFWKKMLLFAGLGLGFFLDYFIPYCITSIHLDLPIKGAIFGMIIGCYIVINECISICENIYKANPIIIPEWLVKMLMLAKKQIDDKVEDKEEEQHDN